MTPLTDPSFMKSPSSMRGAFTDNKPVLQSIPSDDPAIDYIGRWDSSSGAGKTARWAGSSVRFTFSGPLLFLIPGPDTVATAFPTVGWQVDNNSRVTYTATARPHQSIRLWPPEGRAHGQFHAALDGIDEDGDGDGDGDGPDPHAAATPPTPANNGEALPVLLQEQNGAVGETMSRSTTSSQLADGNGNGNGHGASASDRGSAIRSRPSTSGGRSAAYSLDQDGDGEAPGTHTIEITLIDWASVLQISAFQLLSSHSIFSPYAPVPPLSSSSTSPSSPSATPSGIASLPTLLFVGDSITSGYVATPEDAAKSAGGYCGFLDAYPSKLKSILSPGVRVSAVAFPGITLCDDQETGQDGMESRWFKRGPLDIPSATASASRRDASTSSNSSSPAPRSASGASSPAEGDLARLRSAALPEDFDWDFDGREDEGSPTHVLVNLGQNDCAPADKFISTYRDFLNLLRETHGRRTGDILVMPPFGQRVVAEQITPAADGSGPARYRYEQDYYDEIKDMVHELRQRWVQEAQDPLSSGDFPTTPIFELAKLQLDATPSDGLSGPAPSSHLHGRVRGHSHTDSSGSLSAKIQRAAAEAAGLDPGATTTQTSFPPVGLPASGSLASLTSVAGVRPALVVRPSSVAAVEPTSRGTKARLHFVDTKGWLSTEDETFDGVHPTPKGAKVIARKLRDWLGDNGFLAES